MQVRACVLFLLLSFIPLHADEAKDLQKKLQRRFLKQVLVIRHFYSGDHLVFDSQGNLVKGENAIGYDGCRCIAELEIRKLEIKDNELVLRGPRMVGDGSGRKKEFSYLSREHTEVQIDVELGKTQMNEETIAGIFDKIFFGGKDNIRAFAPAAWRATEPTLTTKESGKTSDTPAATKEISRVGHGVAPPKILYSPDPEYSEEARDAKVGGDVILWIVIDQKGAVKDIRIARCLGYGLDESAVRAVSQWRFEPATKDGQPVAVQLNVEVTFHLR